MERFKVTICDLKARVAENGPKYLPYAFTEQGVAMLSSVLNSPRAVQVNIEIMRAFVRLRRMVISNADLALKIDELEKKYDRQFAVVFEAIRRLMEPPKSGPNARWDFPLNRGWTAALDFADAFHKMVDG